MLTLVQLAPIRSSWVQLGWVSEPTDAAKCANQSWGTSRPVRRMTSETSLNLPWSAMHVCQSHTHTHFERMWNTWNIMKCMWNTHRFGIHFSTLQVWSCKSIALPLLLLQSFSSAMKAISILMNLAECVRRHISKYSSIRCNVLYTVSMCIYDI